VSLKEKLAQDHHVMLNELQFEYNDRLQQVKNQHDVKIQEKNNELANCILTINELSEEKTQTSILLFKQKSKSEQLAAELSNIHKQLEMKSQEIATAKVEAITQLKMKEEALTSVHRAELDALHSQYRHQSQALLNDFNKAKEILTLKLQESERRLFEAEEKYKKRESRQEDLEYIKELKKVVSEQEYKLKEMMTEKKVYEMELINREKNYNKLFNATPLTGILDPLQIKKKSTISPSQHSSTQSLISVEDSLLHLTPPKTKSIILRDKGCTSNNHLQGHRKLKFLSDTDMKEKSSQHSQDFSQKSKTMINGKQLTNAIPSTSHTEMVH
jgi:hypothetical protein